MVPRLADKPARRRSSHPAEERAFQEKRRREDGLGHAVDKVGRTGLGCCEQWGRREEMVDIRLLFLYSTTFIECPLHTMSCTRKGRNRREHDKDPAHRGLHSSRRDK